MGQTLFLSLNFGWYRSIYLTCIRYVHIVQLQRQDVATVDFAMACPYFYLFVERNTSIGITGMNCNRIDRHRLD